MRPTAARASAGLDAVTSRSIDPSDARLADVESEVAERVLDRLPLRIEDAGLGPDEHGRLHAIAPLGSARYASNEIPVRRSNAST